jgi:hypothetical protein
MAERITLTTDVPVVIKGRGGEQLAGADQVYTWDAEAAEYGPQGSLDRLVTHDPAGTGAYELVYHSDGSVVWH